MKKLIYLIMLIILSFTVVSLGQWSQSANADNNILGGNAFTGYGSNFANLFNITNTSYTVCNIDGSLYEPLAYDIDNDEINEFLIFSANKISFYTPDCVLKEELNLINNMVTMPVIINTDGDDKQEIAVLSASNIILYEYNGATFINISTTPVTAGLDYFSCPRYPGSERCIALDCNSKSTYYINLITGTETENANELSAEYVENGVCGNAPGMTGLTNTRTSSNIDFLLPVCNINSGALTTSKCDVLNEIGELQFTVSSVAGGLNDPSVDYSSGFIAKLGNVKRIFATIKRDNGVMKSFYTDLSGNKLVEYDNSYSVSNWAVADFDKDGDNDACILLDTNPDLLHCYDSSNTLIYNISYNNDTYEEFFVLADFNPSNDYLTIGNVKGLWSYDGTNYTHFLNTGLTGSGVAITSFSNVAGSNSLVYADLTKGFIIRDNTLTNATCGNGICEVYENAFTCDADCGAGASNLSSLGDSCNIDADCEYGICEGKICVKSQGGDVCNDPRDCITNSCSKGKCTVPTYWEKIDNAKTDLYGDDDNTNNFFALCIMLVLALTIVVYGRGALASIITALALFMALAIFFTIVGWLSAFILFGIFMIVLVGVVVAIIIGSSGE